MTPLSFVFLGGSLFPFWGFLLSLVTSFPYPILSLLGIYCPLLPRFLILYIPFVWKNLFLYFLYLQNLLEAVDGPNGVFVEFVHGLVVGRRSVAGKFAHLDDVFILLDGLFVHLFLD
jgi:hypothetical protein